VHLAGIASNHATPAASSRHLASPLIIFILVIYHECLTVVLVSAGQPGPREAGGLTTSSGSCSHSCDALAVLKCEILALFCRPAWTARGWQAHHLIWFLLTFLSCTAMLKCESFWLVLQASLDSASLAGTNASPEDLPPPGWLGTTPRGSLEALLWVRLNVNTHSRASTYRFRVPGLRRIFEPLYGAWTSAGRHSRTGAASSTCCADVGVLWV